MNINTKIIITIILAIVCTASIVFTKEHSGIGWFLIGLLIIWG